MTKNVKIIPSLRNLTAEAAKIIAKSVMHIFCFAHFDLALREKYLLTYDS
jgi:hypothetical protein